MDFVPCQPNGNFAEPVLPFFPGSVEALLNAGPFELDLAGLFAKSIGVGSVVGAVIFLIELDLSPTFSGPFAGDVRRFRRLPNNHSEQSQSKCGNHGKYSQHGAREERVTAENSRLSLRERSVAFAERKATLRQRHCRRLLHVGQAFFQNLADFLGRCKAVRGFFGHQPGDDRAQPDRNVRIDLTNGGRFVVRNSPHYSISRFGAERRAASADGVEDAAEAEEVAAAVHRFAASLLGGHVLRRAGDDAAVGDGGVIDRPGEAEVSDGDALDAIFQQNVGRLDVAMHQPLCVGRGEPRGNL